MFHGLMGRAQKSRRDQEAKPRRKYVAPRETAQISLPDLLRTSGRAPLADKQLSLLSADEVMGAQLYYAGDLSLVDRPCIAIVGSRSASDAGQARARRLAKELAENGFVVVSGLALGIDAVAHKSAIANGGSTIAVIGTPLNRAYPAENVELQEEIYRDHLLVSPFRLGEQTYKSSFPKRNRVMAAITDATVIVEASDTSGSLHQAAECVRLGRWLFIAKSLAENPALEWPGKFLKKGGKTAVLSATDELARAVLDERK
jgi:DNA processing protein